jgi:hypothetical protein
MRQLFQVNMQAEKAKNQEKEAQLEHLRPEMEVA